MKKLILFATVVCCLAICGAKSLDINKKGNVTIRYKSENVNKAKFNGGKTVTVAGTTYNISELESVKVVEENISDNNVIVTFSSVSPKVIVAGNIATFVDVSIVNGDVNVKQSNQVSESSCGQITYVLQGVSTNGSFSLEGSYDANISLQGLTLTGGTIPALNITNTGKTTVSTLSKTINTLSELSTGNYEAAIYSKGNLEFQGSGTLTIRSKATGVKTEGNLTVTSGTLDVISTENSGVSAEGDLTIAGGVVTTYGSSPEYGLYVNKDKGSQLYLTGGYLLGAGKGNSYPVTSSKSTQPFLTGDITLLASTNVQISNSSKTLYTFKTPSDLTAVTLGGSSTTVAPSGIGSGKSTSIIISVPGLINANTYTVKSGNSTISTIAKLTGNSATTSEVIDPADIPDYDRFYPNSEYGSTILKTSSKFNFKNYAQSEHFFVFWDSSFFGEDPGASSLGSNKVDIKDLLEKAEKFYTTNIEQLGMAEVGVGKSYLDKYKMQIYILDPTPESWVATGSGYDDVIGALWVTPSTMQPVGSVIGHEIGHSFQYQVYADKLYQGAKNDFSTGFRYETSGGQGTGFWEQCAQWQSFQDYPDEQFTSYDYTEWLNNYHRHFHHEWMRYASYWLQTYWTEKHGKTTLANIWKNSKKPEDAIEVYTRVYNGNDWQKTREELFDYAMKMATYDMETLPAIKKNYVKDQYKVKLLINEAGDYQVAYASCPGATGFNIIQLDVPQGGGNVKVNFQGLEYGAKLLSDDPGLATQKTTTTVVTQYNKATVGSSNNMGWRYGFVAYGNGTRTYSTVGKDKSGSLTFNVPAGTEVLYLVVQGSPNSYITCAWDEDETTDAQFPYSFSLEGTDVTGFTAPLKATYKEENGILVGTLNVPVSSSWTEYQVDTYNIADQAVADFFGLSRTNIPSMIVQPTDGNKQTAQRNKIVVFNEESDGQYSSTPTATYGYWVNSQGNAVKWGANNIAFFEVTGSQMAIGQMPGTTYRYGTAKLRPVFIYTNNKGEEKVLKYNITLTYK